jgi:hypothetical protein
VFGRAVQSVIPSLQSVAADTSSLFDDFPDPGWKSKIEKPEKNAADRDAYASRESVMG